MATNKFGVYLRSLRAEKGITLRQFCRLLDKDPGNISKIERGVLSPPKDEIVREFGKVLELAEDSPQMRELLNLAALGAGRIPSEVMEDKELLDKLPLFFRTATGSKLEKEKLKSFIDELGNA